MAAAKRKPKSHPVGTRVKWRVELARAVNQAELELGLARGKTVGAAGVPDVITRASGVVREAEKAMKAPERAVNEAGKRAAQIIQDAASSALEEARKVKDAATGGLEDLLRDAQRLLVGPVLLLVLLYAIHKGYI